MNRKGKLANRYPKAPESLRSGWNNFAPIGKRKTLAKTIALISLPYLIHPVQQQRESAKQLKCPL
jgi:hypothetical protein